jgi:N-acetylglucosaminyl-diphospho-decaprenol L-rhamnosyltransferase
MIEKSPPAESTFEFGTPSAADSAKECHPVDVSVVVINYNTAHLLKEMRTSLAAARKGLTLEIIVVDNASRDGSAAVLRREFGDAQLIFNASNVGFGRANNQALSHVIGRFVLLLNTDAFVSADTVRQTVEFMDDHPDCGIVGVRLVGRDGQLQPGCRHFPTPWNAFLHRTGMERFFPRVQMVDEPIEDDATPRECDWVPGCYMLVRKEVFDQCGHFDPRYFLYFEEVDFCRRVKSEGWKVFYFPQATVVHLGGESAKSDARLTAAGQISVLQIESELLYYRKHFGLLGLLVFVSLALLADALQALKWLARGRPLLDLRPVRDHARSTGSLLIKTRVGAAPTR